MTHRRTTGLATLTLVLLATQLFAQRPEWDPYRFDLTREELAALQSNLGAVARSQVYSELLRAESRELAAVARARLDRGDFRPGDRILLDVRDEEELTDTFTVNTDIDLDLPLVEKISLRGVLFSELERHLTEHIGLLVESPVVRARPTIRLTVLGEIGEPGFHAFPPEMPLADALMLIGGPTANADIEKVRVERGGDGRILEGERLAAALSTGQTIRELSLRSGDRVTIGARPTTSVVGRVGRSFLPALSGVLVSLLIGL